MDSVLGNAKICFVLLDKQCQFPLNTYLFRCWIVFNLSPYVCVSLESHVHWSWSFGIWMQVLSYHRPMAVVLFWLPAKIEEEVMARVSALFATEPNVLDILYLLYRFKWNWTHLRLPYLNNIMRSNIALRLIHLVLLLVKCLLRDRRWCSEQIFLPFWAHLSTGCIIYSKYKELFCIIFFTKHFSVMDQYC